MWWVQCTTRHHTNWRRKHKLGTSTHEIPCRNFCHDPIKVQLCCVGGLASSTKKWDYNKRGLERSVAWVKRHALDRGSQRLVTIWVAAAAAAAAARAAGLGFLCQVPSPAAQQKGTIYPYEQHTCGATGKHKVCDYSAALRGNRQIGQKPIKRWRQLEQDQVAWVRA